MRKLVSVASFIAMALMAAESQAAAVTLVNDGFEASWSATSLVGEDGNVIFNYSPTGINLGWVFGTGTGVVTPKTGLAAAAEGSQYAFLQGETGLLSQTFSLAQAGSADLSFLYGLRPFYANGQSLEVYVDNLLVDTLSTQVGWQTGNLSLGVLSAGSHTISFSGSGFSGLDTTVYLDKVAINVSAVPEPSSALMLSLGLGGLLLAQRRRQA